MLDTADSEIDAVKAHSPTEKVVGPPRLRYLFTAPGLAWFEALEVRRYGSLSHRLGIIGDGPA